MSRVSIIIVSIFLIILPEIIAAPSDSEATQEKTIIARDEWWKIKDLYSDLPRLFNLDDDEKCPVDGGRFYLNCNRCSCFKDHVASCTRKACGITPQIADWADGKPCPAEKKFYFKCNECTCNKDGKSATCTAKPCPEPAQA